MTEASHQMTSNPLPPARAPRGLGRHPGRGRDPDRRRARAATSPAGAAGRGRDPRPRRHARLPRQRAANAEAFFDGWFRTGDEGALEDGYLRLRGRLKEMIIRGGENISPHEIEAVLLAHPHVGEAVAFGVDDDKYGQTVAAAVVLTGAAGRRGAARARAPVAGGVQGARHDPRPRRDPEDADRQGAALAHARAPRGRRRVRFAVLGAGAIGAYVGRGARPRRRRRRPDRPRRASAGDGRARACASRARAETSRRTRRPPTTSRRSPRPTSSSSASRRTACRRWRPAIGALLRPGAAVVFAQNGIPWWYFQGVGGALGGRTLESVDPGGVVTAVDRRRSTSSAASSTARPRSSRRASSGTSRGRGSRSGRRRGERTDALPGDLARRSSPAG